MPRIARAAGRLTGRAVGTVTNLRARVESLSQGAVFAEVHRDLSEGLTQLSAIRAEIRTGFNPMAPGCAAAACRAHHDANWPRRPLAQRLVRSAGRDVAGDEPQAERPPTQPPRAPASAAEHTAAASRSWTGSEQDGRHAFPFLPISAAALGRLPPSPVGRQLSGADIMEQACAEEDVANEAAKLVSMPGALDAAASAYASVPARPGGKGGET